VSASAAPGVRARAGDPLPASVEAFYRALETGDMERATAAFAAGAVYAYGADPANEKARRTVVTGRAALEPALRADLAAFGRPRILVSVHRGRDCFVEGALTDGGGEPVAQIAAVLELDDQGAIARVVSYRTPPLEPSPSWSEPASDSEIDAPAVLERYFSVLAAGDFEAVAAAFAEDALYLHPPYEGDVERANFRGRAELLAGLRTRRGKRAYRPRILACARSGLECFIEGDVPGTGVPGDVGFMSSMSFDRDGLIRRYAAFDAPPAVPRIP
jgi:ketosteroid isomerase-like protein